MWQIFFYTLNFLLGKKIDWRKVTGNVFQFNFLLLSNTKLVCFSMGVISFFVKRIFIKKKMFFGSATFYRNFNSGINLVKLMKKKKFAFFGQLNVFSACKLLSCVVKKKTICRPPPPLSLFLKNGCAKKYLIKKKLNF